MAAVLRVLVDVLRVIAHGAAAVHAGQHGRGCWTSSGCRRTRAAAWRALRHAADRTACPAGAAGRVPALRGAGPASLMLIDSHCHLDYYTEAERPDVLARAAAAGVGEMVTIGTTLAQSRSLPAMAEAQPNLWCTVGVHPHHAAEAPVPAPEDIAALTEPSQGHRHRRVRPGLFLRPLAARRAAGRVSAPISAPRAWPACRWPSMPAMPTQDIAAILQDERDSGGDFDFLLHCFSSSRALAEAAVAMGGYVSFSGILTFPKSS